jgi:sugar phosphate isomerase/epimerase
MNTTTFKKLSFYIIALILVATSCKNSSNKTEVQPTKTTNTAPFFKLSLAQWSLHKTFNEDGVSPFKFAEMSKEMGFEGLEYVNHIYAKQIEALGFDTVIDSLKTLSEKHGMQNVLIMIDGEGDLADPDVVVRDAAVENHKKWIDAAATLGAHAIRVNTFGTNDPELWVPSVVDGLTKLSKYAATKNINVLCENHGWLSSDVPVLMEAIKKVNMSNCGTLPDFGNWCTKREDINAKWGACLEEYPDKYQGIKMMLTEAKAVSAKAYDFDEKGDETTLDFPRIIKMVRDAGYTGYIGVEYEGSRLDETAGTKATRDLLLKAAKEVK